MTSEPAKNSKEILEKRILLLSFISGLFFVAAELVYAVYSHSQSTLMDALYDASELIFIVLILFLTPLFHKPVSEKRPYGFFQVESFFILVKNIMLTSVTVSVLADVIEAFFLAEIILTKDRFPCFSSWSDLSVWVFF